MQFVASPWHSAQEASHSSHVPDASSPNVPTGHSITHSPENVTNPEHRGEVVGPLLELTVRDGDEVVCTTGDSTGRMRGDTLALRGRERDEEGEAGMERAAVIDGLSVVLITGELLDEKLELVELDAVKVDVALDVGEDVAELPRLREAEDDGLTLAEEDGVGVPLEDGEGVEVLLLVDVPVGDLVAVPVNDAENEPLVVAVLVPVLEGEELNDPVVVPVDELVLVAVGVAEVVDEEVPVAVDVADPDAVLVDEPVEVAVAVLEEVDVAVAVGEADAVDEEVEVAVDVPEALEVDEEVAVMVAVGDAEEEPVDE